MNLSPAALECQSSNCYYNNSCYYCTNCLTERWRNRAVSPTPDLETQSHLFLQLLIKTHPSPYGQFFQYKFSTAGRAYYINIGTLSEASHNSLLSSGKGPLFTLGSSPKRTRREGLNIKNKWREIDFPSRWEYQNCHCQKVYCGHE